MESGCVGRIRTGLAGPGAGPRRVGGVGTCGAGVPHPVSGASSPESSRRDGRTTQSRRTTTGRARATMVAAGQDHSTASTSQSDRSMARRSSASPISAIVWATQTSCSFTPCRKRSRCSATGAMKQSAAEADVSSAAVRSAAYCPIVAGKGLEEGEGEQEREQYLDPRLGHAQFLDELRVIAISPLGGGFVTFALRGASFHRRDHLPPCSRPPCSRPHHYPPSSGPCATGAGRASVLPVWSPRRWEVDELDAEPERRAILALVLDLQAMLARHIAVKEASGCGARAHA